MSSKNCLIVKNNQIIFEGDSGDRNISVRELLEFKFNNSGLDEIKYGDIYTSEEFNSLRIRKKPVKISYESNTESGVLNINPLIKGSSLSNKEIRLLVEFGYYISENKLYTALDEDRERLASICSEDKLSEQLRMIAELRTERSILGDSENLIDSLLLNKSSLLEVEEYDTFKHQLYPYQRYGVHWLLHCCINNLGTILGDDMGLGKTAQIIALIAEAFHHEIIDRAMIVVPNSLLENWRREFDFFCPSIVPYLHYGNNRTGLAENLAKYKVVILPYTVMNSDIEMLVDLDVGLLVFDEASLLKNPDSARSIAATRINSRSKVAMTGTPVENNLLDVWSISNIVCPGYLGSKESFTARYIEQNIQDTLENDLTDLEVSISQIMIRRMKRDILADLPEKIDIHQPILMPIEERSEHDQIVSDIRNSADDNSSILMEITRLQKFTAHPCLIDDEYLSLGVQQLINRSAKLERLFELLTEISERSEKVLIFVNHHAAIDLLVSAVKEKFGVEAFNIDGRVEAIERQEVIDTFSAIDSFSVLVLNPKTAGMGLNITSANHVIHYSRQWNPALEEQATARAFRNGQTKDVNAYYLYYADTIEEVIDERLRLKRELADNVVSVVDDKNSEIAFYKENI